MKTTFTTTPDPQLLEDLVRRIVEVAHPQRIILFGSAAREEMGPNSDLDVLVIVPDGTSKKESTQKIYMNMLGFGFAKDIIVATMGDIVKHASNPYLVYKQALKEGKVLYNVA
ncbi:nucleotidyltransferase domain-containing protein [bacterium]|nr:MAG: nucleotidyltransferase domain-containing protein [candidate division KSB1 bacterium]MCE7942390.1 nucleotidyltransferase domain-containing protein [Chlorobi bacterium CHB1]MCL4708349.1 nucleotidyltransferase domain-containing protein [bacterium]MDL1878092.1 nucleotidyltransferase domain-containing protein [Cytophagia bacterium CHB2]MBC6946423.1 nucleotidyltransferase domain-containing protein [candidate division KSB1 bacterium]